ncbi:S-adenosyl-L-methionine-dependent methyltransferase [Phyllosticta capitalensis]|uniref:S-adenosyl-L-methionine-dependent methyltransferase n=1 Tax=Phyllosticta capitalensis TaxID=121624 RepID=UPI003132817F
MSTVDLSSAAADLGIELPPHSTAQTTSTDADDDETLATQSLLLASSHHDVVALRDMLRSTPANVADAETGMTPLHAALRAFEADDEEEDKNRSTNGNTKSEEDQNKQHDDNDLARAAETVKLLLAHGAVWNDLDARGETPGCVAARLGLRECYALIVDAGVRAELLLARLDEYQVLGGGEDEDESDEDEDMAEDGDVNGDGVVEEEEEEGFEVVPAGASESLSASGVVVVDDGNANGEELEASGVVVGTNEEEETQKKDVNSTDYLASSLTFTADCLLDADANGVMMEWETGLMRRHAELLAPKPGLRVLNVGHGMGIIDGIFQEDARRPAAHHIIEAHPAVVARMRAQGWDKKPGVVIHEGRWQDVVAGLVEQNVVFDAIYFDTFAEEYKALRDFFGEYVIGLLDSEGRFGFFNGLGADRKVCYDVYTKIVEMDLFEAGFDTEWEEMPIPDLDANGEWEGVRRKYWVLDTYRLPTCKFIA